MANNELFLRINLQPKLSKWSLRVKGLVLRSLAMSDGSLLNSSANSVSTKTWLMRRSVFSADSLLDSADENMVENFWRSMLGILWPFEEETPSIEF